MTAMDDLSVFLGAMPQDERDLRQRIRTARNAASYNVTRTESADARCMLWMIVETATLWIYRPADLETLGKVVEYLRGLIVSAKRIEELEALA